ncbi:hypothetical protein AJ79_02200 [Helicocarpus griseus UAMH5409]|uniref:Uncharacterized protein n=1 Tax=Helicocarpus griseus UAMH5409 TaxID=1447875 RepID=A0A2B7Y3U4_9EURO|nr:hypothetical protein AJ79_02200 [Helicocarpus griseus UAMH5409]
MPIQPQSHHQQQQQDDKRQAAREVIDILHEISTILAVIKELRKEAAAAAVE